MSLSGPSVIQGGLGLSADSTACVMKAGPQAPAPGTGLCAWRLPPRMLSKCPNQIRNEMEASKDGESQTKTGAPTAVKHLSAFCSAEVCNRRETVLLSWPTALPNARATAHGTEKASGLHWRPGNKARELVRTPTHPALEAGSSSSLRRPGSHSSQASFCSKKAAPTCK